MREDLDSLVIAHPDLLRSVMLESLFDAEHQEIPGQLEGEDEDDEEGDEE
jgi:hypothetical protein